MAQKLYITKLYISALGNINSSA